jgi:hypothetical protein
VAYNLKNRNFDFSPGEMTFLLDVSAALVATLA